MMKPHEGELVAEISKLQYMVSELKSGFSSAMLELSQIQHGDSFLREELEENRRSCQKKARRLEALVEALREQLAGMRSHILQLDNGIRQAVQLGGKGLTCPQKESEPGGRTQCECCCSQQPPSSCSPRGRLLLHSYLQGLKAGLCEETDARHQVVMQLLHSEWEYVSTLNHIYDKYKTTLTQHTSREPYQTYLKFVDQMLQRHLLFRNTLQERLSAEHWKSLVGDILVQLIGHNNTAFADMYLGYTRSLASFLSLEFNRVQLAENGVKKQKDQMEREEVKLLCLLLAPVSRIHGYLGHIQNLLQWTGKEHPDSSLLLGSEKALREALSRCHTILEQDVQWEDGEEARQGSCPCVPPTCASSANCCACSQFCQAAGNPARDEGTVANHRDERQAGDLPNGRGGMHLECWSCSPVRRKVWGLPPQAPDTLRPPDTPAWGGENSDSGQGTSSQPTGRGPDEEADEGETDPDDTSAFDYSSVTSCSPDGTLRTGPGDEEEMQEQEEEEDSDSHVPVLLKPACKQQPRDPCRERTVCLRWQIPRLSPHPPPRDPEGPAPCLVGTHGKRLVSIKKGSPLLHPKSAFRPIWDDPAKQAEPAPERDLRQAFVPVQGQARQNITSFSQKRESLRQAGALQRCGVGHVGGTLGAVWDESEDSEGPCSTV